ncbi:MAG TPA: fumarylacetoacetate hydrolase family protein [Pseudonocardiaceae bacterium]|jgi:2-keto-4-pentenoate hydratase/2-oxohepta-3-ene-1,7-dioic acid hydratase in catechol pathway
MRIARIAHPDGVAFAALEAGPDGADMAAEIADHPFGPPNFTGRRWPLADVRLLAPILPTKIIGIGKNYADHASEMGSAAPANPIMFLKPNTTVIGPGAPIKLPADSEQVDYEGELALVIGRPCRDVPAAQASGVLLGATVGNDVTARDHQRIDGQWTRGKSHDTFCPLGPWIETAADPADLRLRTELDGAVVQDSRTSLLLHGVAELVEWVSRVMTLLPGDVILTGTPAGVGPLSPDQSVSVTIETIGTLTNPVAPR